MIKVRKKLIEVAIPLDAINKASGREKSIRHGHPSTLHLWWARRPLAAARAVIFSQLVDDPSASPERFPTEAAQEVERQRLFRMIEQLVLWESTTDETLLQGIREEIHRCWRATCADNPGNELFVADSPPPFNDPFAGGGALPLEALRLGLEVFADDLNPVSVLINRAMIELPPKYSGMSPVNPGRSADEALAARSWDGCKGLAADVRYYGTRLRNEAERRIGSLFAPVEVTREMAANRPDLSPIVGKKVNVIAWVWARTVKSPNPAFPGVEVPLAATFLLGTKPGKEVHIEPVVGQSNYRFEVRLGKAKDIDIAKTGTKLSRGANFRCLMSGAPISGDYIKAEGKAGRMGARLMAVVAEGERGRIYLPPTDETESLARSIQPEWLPEGSLVPDARAFTPTLYGLEKWADLYTTRQLVVLTTLSDLIGKVRDEVQRDAAATKIPDPIGYANAIATYLGLAVGRVSDYCSTICTWAHNPQMEIVRGTFARQALPMTWDFAEANPFGTSTGSIEIVVGWIAKAIERLPTKGTAHARQQNAMERPDVPKAAVVSTDPPYYDNVPYADLSDYFYAWLRPSLKTVHPDLFATLAVPKDEELVACAYRHGGKLGARAFFLEGMTRVMHRLAKQAHPAFPVTIYYAFKQTESDDVGLVQETSTGWETFLGALIEAGFSVCGTWPIRTEREGSSRDIESNALASSIVLVCRLRDIEAPVATRRELVGALKSELPVALAHLQRGNIAPVDLAQAAIGPGMAIFTRYASVVDADGKSLPVRDALLLINQTLDEALSEQEGDFDADTRWALAWFEQVGFIDGEYGLAETLSKAKNTAVSGLVDAGILNSHRGKVRLLRPDELPSDWDPRTDARLTAWEMVHHLIRVLEAGGESAAAILAAKLGSKAEIARELAYRLFSLCERKKRAPEALAYNALVQSWPEITRLAREGATAPRKGQADLFTKEEG